MSYNHDGTEFWFGVLLGTLILGSLAFGLMYLLMRTVVWLAGLTL